MLDTKTVLPLLKNLVDDPDIGGRVEEAIGDINMFVKCYLFFSYCISLRLK